MSGIIEKAINWAVGIANDNTHGYSQIYRNGPDYDCSSLVINAFEIAGVPVKESGATYTGNMKAAFTKCGFVIIPFRRDVELQRGDVLLNEKYHTALYIGGGKIVQASASETGGKTGKTGDQTGREIAVGNYYVYSKGWDCILRYEEESEVEYVNITLPQLEKGTRCPEVGTVQVLLNKLGYVGKTGKPLTVDHDYGANTAYAVGNFQRANGITGDEIVGAKTWPRLLGSNY